MSEDGGLSESLNMYLDTAESAPAFVPEDVTEKLGLPADLGAERIFIHKTANYENYIVVQGNRVVAYTPGIEDKEPLLILELEEGEKVNDINSMGNMVILSTTRTMSYILFENRAYTYMGTQVPFPQIVFNPETDVSQQVKVEHRGYMSSGSSFQNTLWFANESVISLPEQDEWNSYSNNKNELDAIQKCHDDFWNEYAKVEKNSRAEGWLTGNVYIRYAIETINGVLSSIPILIKNPYSDSIAFDINMERTTEMGSGGAFDTWYTESISAIIPRYQISARLLNTIPAEWRKYILNIRIYISLPMPLNVNEQKSELQERSYNGKAGGPWTWTGKGVFYSNEQYKDILLEGYQTYLVKKINILNDEKTSLSNEINKLLEGTILSAEFALTGDKLVDKEPLVNDDMKHYLTMAMSTESYNNRLILIQPLQLIDYDYARLNTYCKIAESNQITEKTTFNVSYILAGYKEDKVVKKQFVYNKDTSKSEYIYAFQVFPDSRAYKMEVEVIIEKIENGTKTQEVRYGTFPMYPHPYLNCAYYYGGIQHELATLCDSLDAKEFQPNTSDDIENYLLISAVDDPAVFPTSGRFVFQSKVVGIAVATTTLSQGQFGQFPLYVFTEDGIWAMETAADGSFVSQKPLSREVCINPDSICSIDNAVVFVTGKAVMMIQGSQVMNISPYMNGKHYRPNDSALNLIRSQEGFDALIDPIKDDDPFMSFMKDAKVAYDYTGQRLIFISPSNKGFQYVYKIDTQTWHKVAFSEFDLYAPLNSYPECLVQTQPDATISESKTLVYIHTSNPINNIALIRDFKDRVANEQVGLAEAKRFLNGDAPLDKAIVGDLTPILDELAQEYDFEYTLTEETKVIIKGNTKVVSLSTVLDASTTQDTAKGILITRPFDLGEPDVFKTITDVRIRGQFPKGAVKFILQASNDWVNWVTISTLRGRAWKLFRIFVLADLEPTDRISWIDVQYETKFTNKLR